VRAALLLPYIIPTVLSYEAWRWMFDPTFSVINWLLVNTHLVQYPGPNWLGVPANAMAALMIVNVWRGTPFYAIAFLAGMQVIPGGAIGLGAAISLVLLPRLTIVVAGVLFMLRRPE